MRISIFGLGYVGVVCAACLSKRNHNIIGVDVHSAKIKLINQGKSPIVEPGLGELLADAVKNKRLTGTMDVTEAINNSDISLICVGTPSKRNGDLDLTYLKNVCQEIGQNLKNKASYHTVVIRSTVLPGTVKNVVIPILEQESGKNAGSDFGIATNPEFLRESTAIADYDHPPITVIGELDSKSGDLLEELYSDLDAPILRKPIEVAEMIKYTCNVWHAVKVTFANEIGNVAKACGVDGRDVMDIICQDNKLNISSYYMKPGFAFGGSCLPKDMRALNYRAAQLDVNTPMLSSVMVSNSQQVRNAFNMIDSYGKRKVTMLGLSFKAGTDDLRESPLVELAEILIGKGYELKIYDHNVEYARVFGANKEYIESKIPHVSCLLTQDLEGAINFGEVIVLGNSNEEFGKILDKLPENKHVLDLIGFLPKSDKYYSQKQEGICW